MSPVIEIPQEIRNLVSSRHRTMTELNLLERDVKTAINALIREELIAALKLKKIVKVK